MNEDKFAWKEGDLKLVGLPEDMPKVRKHIAKFMFNSRKGQKFHWSEIYTMIEAGQRWDVLGVIRTLTKEGLLVKVDNGVYQRT
jgi:cobyric acid synthase